MRLQYCGRAQNLKGCIKTVVEVRRLLVETGVVLDDKLVGYLVKLAGVLEAFGELLDELSGDEENEVYWAYRGIGRRSIGLSGYIERQLYTIAPSYKPLSVSSSLVKDVLDRVMVLCRNKLGRKPGEYFSVVVGFLDIVGDGLRKASRDVQMSRELGDTVVVVDDELSEMSVESEILCRQLGVAPVGVGTIRGLLPVLRDVVSGLFW